MRVGGLARCRRRHSALRSLPGHRARLAEDKPGAAIGGRQPPSVGTVDGVPGAVEALRTAARDGRLEGLCVEFDMELVVLFGSATRDPATARDLDLAVRFEPYEPSRVLLALDALSELAGPVQVDLMILNRAGPVAREQALVFGELLWASRDDTFAEAQIAAVLERLDTDHLRRVELELLAEGSG